MRNNNRNEGKKLRNTDMGSIKPILLLWLNFRSDWSFLHQGKNVRWRQLYNSSITKVTSSLTARISNIPVSLVLSTSTYVIQSASSILRVEYPHQSPSFMGITWKSILLHFKSL
jgi:hypothetical protein